MENMTAAQTTAVNVLSAEHGRPYWPSLTTRPTGLLDATFIDGSGFVITPNGSVRPA